MRKNLSTTLSYAFLTALMLTAGCGKNPQSSMPLSRVDYERYPQGLDRRPPPSPVVVKDPSQLVGIWEATTMADSGHDPKPLPPGTFFVFGADSKITLGCSDAAPSGKWTLDPTRTTIHVTLGNGSVQVNWVVLDLNIDNFTFVEGGDLFTLARRPSCP